MPEAAPLILTLQLDPESFAFFNNLRQKHFPPQINYLDAHLTLFHHLPPSAAITQRIEQVAAKQRKIALEVSGLMKLGRGVAYKIKSDELVNLQEYFKKQWQEWLTPQDKQKFNPHITVQNKVDAATANTLYQELAVSEYPVVAEGIGLSLWEYKGGPWQKVKDYAFKLNSAGSYQ